MKQEIIFLMLMIGLAISSILLGYFANEEISSMISKIRSQDIESPEECNNLTMKETAYCLNDFVRSIFKYKRRPDIENPTLEELIEEGGDCKNWADLYSSYIRDLGFNEEQVRMRVNENSSHVFSIISNEDGYCMLDQEIIKCFELYN